jgi:hypothetical protein
MSKQIGFQVDRTITVERLYLTKEMAEQPRCSAPMLMTSLSGPFRRIGWALALGYTMAKIAWERRHFPRRVS